MAITDYLTFSMAYTAFAGFIGGPFVYGWNIQCVGLPSGYVKVFINQSLYDHYGVYDPPGTDTWQKALFSVAILLLSLGGAIGGSMSGKLADKVGRKNAVLMTHFLALIASILYGVCVLANSFELLFLARFLVGIGAGACFAIVPVYATEITPIEIRGAVGTGSQLFITMGILFGAIFTLDDTLGSVDYWPVGMACMAFFSALSGAMLLMPAAIESPKWLLIVCRDEAKATVALQILNNRQDVSDLLYAIKKEANLLDGQPKDDEPWGFSKLFNTKQLRWPITLVILLNIAQQLSGINVVFFYAGVLYGSAGLGVKESGYAAVAVNGINVLSTLLAVPLIERYGRRPLLLYPMVLMCAALVAQVLLLTLKEALDVDESIKLAMSWGAIGAVAIFVVGFALGLGPIPLFLASEIFRPGPRATASAVGTVTNLTFTLLVSILFDNVLQTFLTTYSFLPFLVCSVISLVFFWIKLPETKNRDVSDIYRDLGYPDEDPAMEMVPQKTAKFV